MEMSKYDILELDSVVFSMLVQGVDVNCLVFKTIIIKSKQIIYIPDSITKSFGYTQVVSHQSLHV